MLWLDSSELIKEHRELLAKISLKRLTFHIFRSLVLILVSIAIFNYDCLFCWTLHHALQDSK